MTPILANAQHNKNFVPELYGIVFNIWFLAEFITHIRIKMK